jgi:hypothetical protein
VNPHHLQIRELAAWGVDGPVDRGSLSPEQLKSAVCHAQRTLKQRKPHRAESPISAQQSRHLANLLATRKNAVADSGEFDGLAWKLAIVDLRKLIAFQRRVGFAVEDHPQLEHGATWKQLLDLALPVHAPSRSPYIEVASYGDRWFLRDGYHRSFRLLKQGISLVPAVVMYAETLAEMGAVGSQFFAEEILFSKRPPMVTDFLVHEMVLRYLRPHRDTVVQGSSEKVQVGCHSQEEI